MIDLHTHSSASDGKLSPAELMRLASELRIEVIALTDHDTLSGLEEAAGEASRIGIDFIPGIEISALNDPGTMHILGYFIDPGDDGLTETLSWLRGGRDDRNTLILKKLADLGCPLDMEEIEALAGGESIGRPHIAQAMLSHGYVYSFNEAFEKYLGKGAAAYVDRKKMTPERAIESIRQAGGMPVLAHPQTLGLEDRELEELVAYLASQGLAGMEVYYYSHTEMETEFYLGLADRFDLAVTGGSDFHGPGLVETRLGVGRGNLNVPKTVADSLRERHKSRMR